MYTATNTCPVCGGEMMVTGLECRACASELRGRFALGRLYRLNPEQMHFVETLIKNRGQVSKAGDELDLTYATARSRLDDVIEALGYEVVPEEEPVALSPEKRKLVLEQLAQGDISSEEAIEMLRTGQVKVKVKAKDKARAGADEPAPAEAA
ncbi:MAG: DUF2089 domain-containing protein [Chloroflexi bacterium]|nr:DUF2089 domain-containing protein [Chloroflexota bacterium]MBU1749909.1 DUF2089 domain-containing protein [Chloroflexota bacterium]MBU1879369.1 DUF2089 domain-containing protein [Chloroflexota bacterium]